MIRTLILAITMLMASTAFASGKITLAPSYHFKEKTWAPTVGFAVYHPLLWNKVFATSWTGLGQDPKLEADGSHKYWFASTNGLEVMLGNFVTLGSTVTIARDTNADSWDNKVNLKLAIQLW